MKRTSRPCCPAFACMHCRYSACHSEGILWSTGAEPDIHKILTRSFCRKFEVPGGRRGGLADRWRPDELLDQGMLTGKSQLELIVPVLELRWDLHEFGDQVIQTQVFQVRAF